MAPITEDLDFGKIAAETVYGHFKLLVVWCGLRHFLVYIPLGLSPMTFIRRLEDTNDKLHVSVPNVNFFNSKKASIQANIPNVDANLNMEENSELWTIYIYSWS